MSKQVDEGTTVELEWWDPLTGTWASAGEFETQGEALSHRNALDEQNAQRTSEPIVWRMVTSTVEAI